MAIKKKPKNYPTPLPKFKSVAERDAAMKTDPSLSSRLRPAQAPPQKGVYDKSPYITPNTTIEQPASKEEMVTGKNGNKELKVTVEQKDVTDMPIEEKRTQAANFAEDKRIREIAGKEAKYNQLVGQEETKLIEPFLADITGIQQPQQMQAVSSEVMQEDMITSSVGSHTLELLGEEERAAMKESFFFPSAEEGARRRMETFGTESKGPAIATGLAAGVAVGAIGYLATAAIASGALSGVVKTSTDAVIKGAAKLAGAKYPEAALKGTFKIRPSAVIWGATTLLGRTVFSIKGLAVGGMIAGANQGSKIMGSLAVADMKDQAEFLKSGDTTYADAVSDYDWDVQSFMKAKKTAKFLSKVPVLKSFSKGLGIMTYFEIEERNLPIYRKLLDDAARENAITQARIQAGVQQPTVEQMAKTQ